jgi:hypothetical protein
MTWRKQNSSFFKVVIASAFSLALPFCAIICPFSAAASTLADADGLLLQNKLKQAEDSYRELLEEDQTGDAYAGLAVALAKQSWPANCLKRKNF